MTWTKYANNPVLGGDYGTCFDLSMIHEDGKFKMWFSWRPKKSIGYTESLDGFNWSEPVVVLADNPESGWEDDLNRVSVVRKGDLYHMWYTGQTNEPEASRIGYVQSQDGIHWTRVREQPVLVSEEPWEKVAVMVPQVIWDEQLNLYRMWYSAGEQYEPNAIGYATSEDGIAWVKESSNPIFTKDLSNEWERHKVAGAQVFKHGRWHYMFYIGFEDEHTARIGIARSTDGISNWEKYPANPIVEPTPGEWDGEAVYKPFVLKRGDKWFLWYNGRNGALEQIGVAIFEGEHFWND
ncbi:family 43 glycosylhydrolase [Cohnella sp. GCM10020058]|uniref:family 43 glycosylhydrolase n=1 Tax=Cohnella sp. GCM10020058 TaxID=3317330 RepID=UPI003624F040